MGRPTINDVATAAGVSKGAVSFALNDRPGIAPETRRRILDVADELGLDPQPAGPRAVGLPGARRRPGRRPAARDPPRRRVLPRVHRRPRDRAVRARARAAADGRRARRRGHATAGSPQEGRVDGVFVTDLRVDDPRPALLEELGLPGVVDRPGPRRSDADPDARRRRRARASRAAVEHLVDLGHTAHRARRPARSRWCTAGPAARRGARRCATAGLPEGLCVEADFSAESGRRRDPRAARPRRAADRDRLRQRPDGDGRPLAGRLPRGLASPGELSVTGFDDIEIAAHLQPSLTTVSTDVVAWGRAAATRLLELIDARRSPPRVDLPPARLVVRASTGPAPT